MFRITDDPSSWRLVQCLAKNFKNDSIVSVDMDKISVMTAYSDALCVCVFHCIWSAFIYSELHKATHSRRLSDGGSSVIRNMFGTLLNIL